MLALTGNVIAFLPGRYVLAAVLACLSSSLFAAEITETKNDRTIPIIDTHALYRLGTREK